MSELKVFTKEMVTGGDTYEIAYAHSYPERHWSEDSLYFNDDEDGIKILSPYFDKVFPEYAYYGPQKVRIYQWNEIERLCREENNENISIEEFFEKVRSWINKGNKGEDYFWFLGL